MTKSDLFSIYILENIKFSNEMPYHLASLLDFPVKLQFSKKITKMNRFSLKSTKYQIFH